MENIKEAPTIQLTKKIMYQDEFYTATVLLNDNIIKQNSSFFPANWTRERIMDAIVEAYNDFVTNKYEAKKQHNNIYTITGKLENNIEIEMLITANNEIVTAYPILKEE